MALHPRSDQFCGCIGASFLRDWLFQLQAGLSTYRPWNNPQRWRQSLVDDDDDDHVKILGHQFGKFCKATHWHRIFMHVSWLRIKIPSPPGKLRIETMGFAWSCNGSSSIHFGGSGGPGCPPSKAKGSPGSSRLGSNELEMVGYPKSWMVYLMANPMENHGKSYKKMDELALPPWLGKPPCGHLLVNKHVAVECLLMNSKGHDWEIADSQILTENTHAFHVHGEYCLKCFEHILR